MSSQRIEPQGAVFYRDRAGRGREGGGGLGGGLGGRQGQRINAEAQE